VKTLASVVAREEFLAAADSLKGAIVQGH